MTQKDRHALEIYWHALHDCNRIHGRYVTAGELARHLEISRNTAAKYLKKMVAYDGAHASEFTAKNGVIGTCYGVRKVGE